MSNSNSISSNSFCCSIFCCNKIQNLAIVITLKTILFTRLHLSQSCVVDGIHGAVINGCRTVHTRATHGMRNNVN